MRSVVPHTWDVSIEQAQAIQNELASKVIRHNQFTEIRTVAGVDLSYPDAHTGRAAIVVLEFPSLQPLTAIVMDKLVTFPYIPGLFAFREAPVALAAFERLALEPDLIMLDGQGLAHPRRMGIACHIGLYLDRPTIGCAKSRLIGKHDPLGAQAGQWAALRDRDEVIGAVVRTRSQVSPVYVSIGHRIDLPTTIDFVLRCTRNVRIPEPTRWAHNVAGGATWPGEFSRFTLDE